MVGVQHASDTVKAEAVKLVLVHPEAQVAQQEAKNFMTAIVEQSAVPKLVSSSGTLVEVLRIATIKLIQTIQHVLRSMAVNDIQQDSNT